MDFPFPEPFNESVTKLFVSVGPLALNVSAASTVSVGVKMPCSTHSPTLTPSV